jgi:hypothetical protein
MKLIVAVFGVAGIMIAVWIVLLLRASRAIRKKAATRGAAPTANDHLQK